MNEERCICCGSVIPEGRQMCWTCEHMMNEGQKPPSEKQIALVESIAKVLNIDFPWSSTEFTVQAYWQFINNHIEEARSYWGENESDEWLYDIDWFDPLNS